MDCGNLIKMIDDYANMKTDTMNTLNAFGYIGMSLMQLNDFSFIQVNDEPDNEINVFQHMFAMVFIMKKKHQRLFHRVCHVESVRGIILPIMVIYMLISIMLTVKMLPAVRISTRVRVCTWGGQ